MKIIGKTEVQEGTYPKHPAYVCIITHEELAKVADKARYSEREKMPEPKIGDDYPIAEGHDFRRELTDAIRAMQMAYEKFSKAAPIAAEFAGVIVRKADEGAQA